MYVFVDEVTGEPKTYGLAQFTAEVARGDLQVVSGEELDSRTPREQRFDLVTTPGDLPEKYEKDLERRQSYVAHMRRAGATLGARKLIVEELKKLKGRIPRQAEGATVMDRKPPKASTVMGWMRAFRRAGNSLAGLVSGNAHRRVSKRLPANLIDICWTCIDKFYLTRARKSLVETKEEVERRLQQLVQKARSAVEVAEAAEIGTVSESTLRRMVREIDPYVVCKRRFGAAYANNLFRFSLGGARARYPMQRYEVDHTILDVVVVCNRSGLPLGRPTITVVIDACSGYIVGFFVSFWGSGLASTLAALKVAIMPKDDITQSLGLTNRWIAYGIPALYVVDNGLEFHARDFMRAAMLLNSDVMYCAVRRPWLKPFVERSLREMNKFLPSEGRVHKPKNNYLPPSPDKTAALAFNDLCACLTKAVVDVHATQPNKRTMTTPLDCFSEGMAELLPPMLPTSMDELNLIAAISDERQVSHDGVVFEYLRYSSPELAALRRATGTNFMTSIKFNPEDLRAIYVRDPVSKGWLTVPSCLPEYTTGLSVVQHRAIRKALKGRLSERNAYELFMQEKRKLTDMWRSAIKLGKKLPKQAVLAMEGLTSSCSYKAAELAAQEPPRPEIVVGGSHVKAADEEAYEEYESILV